MKMIPKVFGVFLTLIFGISIASFSATSAGTDIEGQTEYRYSDQVKLSNINTLEVDQEFGLTLVPTDSTGSITPEGTYYFPHRVSNVGNGSDLVTFSLNNITPEGWSAQLIVDENFNQVHDPSETTPVPTQAAISEDAIYDFFLALTAPSSESTGEATVTITSEGNDGDGYYGSNGIFYGGVDTVEATDTASVEGGALWGLYIHRNDSSGAISLTWEGGAADVYYITGSYEAGFSGSSVEAYNVTSPWISSQITAQDGETRYYRVTAAGFADAYAPETVGKFDAAVIVGISQMSLPLVPYTNNLSEVIGTQVTGASNAYDADRVWKYNPAVQGEFDIAWLVGGVGPPYDGQWYTGNNPTTMTLGADEGFIVQIRQGHSATYITFTGQVSDTNRTISISKGMNFVGTCFPVSVPLGDQSGSGDSNLWESGATGANNAYDADRVWRYNPAIQGEYDIAWLVDNVSPTYNGLWYTGNNPTTIKLDPGKGYWIQVRDAHSAFTWTYKKPY